MSKHFDDLMYNAGLTASGCWDELDDYAKEAIMRYSKLIVQECIRVGGIAFIRDNSILPVFPVEQIKQHFGVE